MCGRDRRRSLSATTDAAREMARDDIESARPQPRSLHIPSAVLGDLIGTYFRLIHNIPHTLFHEPSFLAALNNDDVPKFTTLAMAALSARYVYWSPILHSTDSTMGFLQMCTFEAQTLDFEGKSLPKKRCVS